MKSGSSKDLYKNRLVAAVGAGPAGLYAAQYLAKHGVNVVLFNRDIKPGGLAEYGIFPDKLKMRSGLLTHFKRILELSNIFYCGNIKVGQSGDIKLDQLRQAGFDAIMITTGAQLQHWLGLPGKDLDGVYQANEIVFHYNQLPEFVEKHYKIGRQVAVIGMGNVMLDIVHYLKIEKIPRSVTAYARRGPTEVKFDKQTLEPVADCLDLQSIKRAVVATEPSVEAVCKDIGDFYDLLEKAKAKTQNCESGLSLKFAFLRSPRRLIGDRNGRVKAVVFEVNRLLLNQGEVISKGTQEFEMVPADTVIFSIGSQVDAGFGLPVEQGHFVTNPNPRYPVEGISYEVYNPELCSSCEDIFVSGWARKASEGIVGLARQDAERGAQAVLRYLEAINPDKVVSVLPVIEEINQSNVKMIQLKDLQILWAEEARIAEEKGLPVFKYGKSEEMLRVMGKL